MSSYSYVAKWMHVWANRQVAQYNKPGLEYFKIAIYVIIQQLLSQDSYIVIGSVSVHAWYS